MEEASTFTCMPEEAPVDFGGDGLLGLVVLGLGRQLLLGLALAPPRRSGQHVVHALCLPLRVLLAVHDARGAAQRSGYRLACGEANGKRNTHV